MRSPEDDQAAVADSRRNPPAPPPSGALVTSSPILVISKEGAMRAAASRAPRRWRRLAHRARQPTAGGARRRNYVPRPEATTCLTSARGPRGEHRGQRVATAPPDPQPGRVQGQRHEVSVRRRARSPPPRASQGRHARRRSPPASRSAALKCPRRLVTRRCESSSQRCLFEQVDHAVPSLPSASGDPAAASAGAGPTPSARSASVSGHMHTVDREPASSSSLAQVRCVACT